MSLVILYFKITPRVGSEGAEMGTWFASSPQVHKTAKSQLKATQARADRLGLGCDYELATREEYDAYRAHVRAVIDASPKTVIAKG